MLASDARRPCAAEGGGCAHIGTRPPSRRARWVEGTWAPAQLRGGRRASAAGGSGHSGPVGGNASSEGGARQVRVKKGSKTKGEREAFGDVSDASSLQRLTAPALPRERRVGPGRSWGVGWGEET